MKKNELTKAVLTALLLASSSVMAASDYPAADFQPKVIYSDSGAGGSSSAATAAKSAVAADPKFPAANFEPKVVFSDTDYKHSQTAPSASAAKSSVSSAASDTTETTAASEQPASSNNNLIGLLALAVVGFFLYNKKSADKPAVSKVSQVVASVDTGATGVEKYLEKQGITKTGVAKYLDKQGANPATGVAKYMAKQIVKDREAAAARATGVEKYLRDKV